MWFGYNVSKTWLPEIFPKQMRVTYIYPVLPVELVGFDTSKNHKLHANHDRLSCGVRVFSR